MRYFEAKPRIRSGDLLAFSHFGWRTWHDLKIQVVRTWQRSEYSHVGVAWNAGTRTFCLEAVMPKIRIYPLSQLGEFYWLQPTRDYWNYDVEEFALSKVGENYSQLQAIQSAFGQPKKDNLWQCSEYVKEIFRLGGYDLGSNITPTGIVKSAQYLDFSSNLVQPNVTA